MLAIVDKAYPATAKRSLEEPGILEGPTKKMKSEPAGIFAQVGKTDGPTLPPKTAEDAATPSTALSPEMKKHFEAIHVEFGHCTRSELLRTLQDAGASLYRCETCAELSRPSTAGPAAVPSPHEFNHEVIGRTRQPGNLTSIFL